jgi:hypothetical protein
MIFGTWWFLNMKSIIREITLERVELLGLSFIPQHSDARVLEQVIYKWKHSKEIIADVLADKYGSIIQSGWVLTDKDIAQDIENYFSGNFKKFCGIK